MEGLIEQPWVEGLVVLGVLQELQLPSKQHPKAKQDKLSSGAETPNFQLY